MAESMITPTPEGDARFPVKRVEFTKQAETSERLFARIFELAKRAINSSMGLEPNRGDDHE